MKMLGNTKPISSPFSVLKSPISSPFGMRFKFNPLSWFAAGEQGAWYDPSDITTLFQDSAGTTPMSAVGTVADQPVGLMRDKSGRGNHAFQATAGNRPMLSARVNLLTKTEDFSDAVVWADISNSTVSTNQTLAPDNTLTADKISEVAVFGMHYVGLSSTGIPCSTNTLYTFSCRFKIGTSRYVWISISPGNFNVRFTAIIDLQTATVTNTYTSGISAIASASSANNGLVTASITINSDVETKIWVGYGASPSSNPTVNSFKIPAFNGDINNYYYAWGADLRPTNAGSLLPPYQRVNTASDYDTVGFPLYLKANGSSSAMLTNSIDFTATNKMTVVTGVRKLAEAINIILETSTELGGVGRGAFLIHTNASSSYRVAANSTSSGWAFVADDVSTFTSPISNVISANMDVSKSVASQTISSKVNGAVPTQTYSGTPYIGTLGNYPLYLFARAGTSLFLNGQFYGAIIRGAQSDTASITQTENYMATKTGITF